MADETETERLQRENAALKKMLRDNCICPYGVQPPGTHWSQCPLGFPGCSCGDDEVLAEDVPTPPPT